MCREKRTKEAVGEGKNAKEGKETGGVNKAVGVKRMGRREQGRVGRDGKGSRGAKGRGSRKRLKEEGNG